MLDANQESILRNCRSVSVKVTPFTCRISASAASNSASCVSSGISNGSLRNGLCQLSMYASSAAITTSLRFAIADAFAITTARPAQADTPSRVNRSVDANPQAPPAKTRIPNPIDSDWANVPTCPFFVVRSRCRKCITRTSAYFAPRTRAVSKACPAKSHITMFPSRRGTARPCPSEHTPENLQDFAQKEKRDEAAHQPRPQQSHNAGCPRPGNILRTSPLFRYFFTSLAHYFFLGSFIPRSQIMLLLRRQLIQLVPHRFQLQSRNLAIQMFGHYVNLRLHRLVILHQIFRRQRLVREAHI